MKCPDGTHSPAGSIGTDPAVACKEKRNCSFEEIPKDYAPTCYNMQDSLKRIISLNLKPMEVCELNMTEYKGKTYKAECGNCELGNILTTESNQIYLCTKCPANTYKNDFASINCSSCPTGHYL